MDALILSCGTGGGHNAAADAVKEELLRHGHHVVMMNPYTLKSSRLAYIINMAYILVVQKSPWAFGFIYTAGEIYRRFPFRSPVYFVNKKMVWMMKDFLEKNHFDIIIMPHLFPAEILTNMKLHGMEIPKTMFIATDYTCIPFTEESECDAYVIPDEGLRDVFVSRGILEKRIYPLGIPVSAKFQPGISKEAAKRRLGIDLSKKCILISGGSVGAGKIAKTVSWLNKGLGYQCKVQIIVVCGNNERLYRRLRRRYHGNIKIISHTDKMALYLKACDLYITKPGGLSSTEAAVSGVPLMYLPPIPGCETYNLKFFTERGMSRKVQRTKEGLAEIRELLEGGAARTEMIKKQHRHIDGEAVSKIYDLACELVGEDL